MIQTQFFQFHRPDSPLKLRCGDALPEFTLAYETYGQLNADRTNAVLLFHAMTGSQHAAGYNPKVPGVGGRWTPEMQEGWWDDFIGPGKTLDTEELFVVCANYLGGCYGSTGPASIHPETGRPWGRAFPVIRICDIVDAQVHLLDHLGIETLRGTVGASLGGFMALSLATRYPDRVRNVVAIGTGMGVTPLQRVMNFEQVTAIEFDPDFNGGDYYGGTPPNRGLALARRIAHKTFISVAMLEERARHEIVSPDPPFGWYEMSHPVESYMLHQGQRFVNRFDANSYLRILDAWQWMDLAGEAGASDSAELFARCRGQNYLVFSIDSDASFLPEEQGKLVAALEAARVPVAWITVHSGKGHDSFLLEPNLYAPYIRHRLGEQ